MVTDALYRKTVWRLLLPIAVLTFINSIDRMNVSFAAQQMSRDVGLTPTGFGVGVSTFFIAYLLFQYPHALLLRRLGIRLWLLLSMTVWGIAGVMMSRVQDPQDFVTARFVLGAAEAGFAPGMTWYISQWTPRATRARAMAIALSAVPFSLVVGGPLCGWLLGMSNPLGLQEWRWMFLVSAVPNFVFAAVAAAYFVDRPGQARWLDGGEGQRLEAQIASEASSGASGLAFAKAVRNGRIWLCASVWFLVMTGSYALVYWLPQIVRQLAIAESELLIGTLSALPQVGLVTGLFLNARHSDRQGERLWHTAAGALVAGMALIAAAALPVGPSVLVMLVIAGFGIGAAQGVFWTVPATLGIGGGQVPIGVIAAVSMAGTAGGVVGPSMMGWLVDRIGNHAPAIMILAGFLLLAALLLALSASWRGRNQ
jgi:ACS family tartrate transporter-like MFS transporter